MPKIDVLQEMLNAGLLKVPGDTEYNLLKKAVNDLSSRFEKAPKEVITAVLVALDANAPHAEAIFGIAEKHILRHWRTFRGKNRSFPVMILRAVILSAIIKSSNIQEVAIAAWYASASVIPYFDFPSREGQTITRIMSNLAEEAVKHTQPKAKGLEKYLSEIDSWSTESLSVKEYDGSAYTKLVAWAVGPNRQSGEAIEGGNPTWSNEGAQWCYEFTNRMPAVLGNAQKRAADQAVNAIYENFSELAFEKISGLARILIERESANLTQLNILSWAYALYSRTLLSSYRELPLVPAAVAMAYDLISEAGVPCPPSVVYMLGESISRLDSGEKRPLINYLEEVRKHKEILHQIVFPPKDVLGRIQLISAVNLAAHDHDPTAICTKPILGVDPDIQISTSEFGMWCFRDLQAISVTDKKK